MNGKYIANAFVLGFLLGGTLMLFAAKSKIKDVRAEYDTPGTEQQPTDGPTFEDLVNALEFVESKGDANAVGDYKETIIHDKDMTDDTKDPDDPWYKYRNKLVVGEYRAVGAYQIHKIYVDDVNRILREDRYTYADRWDRDKSREMTEIYIMYYAGIRNNVIYRTSEQWYEAMARIHNGGPDGWKSDSTLPYWEKIKARLETRYLPMSGSTN